MSRGMRETQERAFQFASTIKHSTLPRSELSTLEDWIRPGIGHVVFERIKLRLAVLIACPFLDSEELVAQVKLHYAERDLGALKGHR